MFSNKIIRILYKIFSLIFFISFLFPQIKTVSPENIVEQYLDLTLKKNDYKSAYQLLSSSDKILKTEKSYIEENAKNLPKNFPKEFIVLNETDGWRLFLDFEKLDKVKELQA